MSNDIFYQPLVEPISELPEAVHVDAWMHTLVKPNPPRPPNRDYTAWPPIPFTPLVTIDMWFQAPPPNIYVQKRPYYDFIITDYTIPSVVTLGSNMYPLYRRRRR